MIRWALPALALCVAVPTGAEAHAVLTTSTPPIDGTVAPGHALVSLHYNSRIDRGRSLLVLTQPDHGTVRLPVSRTGPEDELDTQADLAAPGAYNIRWQVLAVDGHITRGDVPFTVAPAGAPPAGK